MLRSKSMLSLFASSPMFFLCISSRPFSSSLLFALPSSIPPRNPRISPPPTINSSSSPSRRNLIFIRNSNKHLGAAWQPPKYVYPDPIPEFAVAETLKFRDELRKKLLKSKESFGDDIDLVVNVCAEIFSEFLHKEYGGPGTLLVEPFTDMLLALKEKKLTGAPFAARAALLWAQNYVDRDWEIWTSQPSR